MDYPMKVRVITNEKNEGLIRSKVIAANQAKAPILMFLEPHVIWRTRWTMESNSVLRQNLIGYLIATQP